MRRARVDGGVATPAEAFEGDATITLGLLEALHNNAAISQRSLASALGIALGLTNAYVRRCIRRGLVKVHQAPANRYAYYLTPSGCAEKSRLTARYLSRSFSFYRRARTECDEMFGRAAVRGWRTVGLFGIGDLAEVAVLCSIGQPVAIGGAVAPGANRSQFVGVPVVQSVAALGPVDGLLLTEFERPQASYDALALEFPAERILVPALLKVHAAGAGSAGKPQE